MSRPFSFAEAAAPHAPAVLLGLAAALGGLRHTSGWLAFAAVLLAWSLLRPQGLSLSGFKAPALFWGWLASAALFSAEPAASLAAASRHALAGLFFLWALSYKEGARSWLGAVYALACAAAAVFLAQRFYGADPTGFIGANPNYCAAFCAAAFAAAMAGLAAAAGRRGKLLHALLVLTAAAGLIASGSRGALLAGFLSAAAGLVYLRSWRWLAALLAAALAGAAFLPGQAIEALLKFYDPRSFARPRLWGAALEAAAAAPLLGWGPGLFESAFELFKFPYFDGLAYYGHSTKHAHSEILNLAAEAGFPAAAFFIAAAVSGLARGWRENLPFKLCALAVLLQACVDMTFYSGAVSLLFWGSLGFSAACGGTAPGPLKARAAAVCLAGLLAGYAAAPVQDRVSGSVSYGESRANPALALGAAWLRELENPLDPFAYAQEGRLLLAVGYPGAAVDAFGRALALEPAFAGARLGLASAYAASGRDAEACAALDAPQRPVPPRIYDSYRRGLLYYDRAAAARLKKELCGKKKTGSATASRPGTSSKATR